MLPHTQGWSVVMLTSSKLKRHGFTSRHRIIPGAFTVPRKRRKVMLIMLIWLSVWLQAPPLLTRHVSDKLMA